MKLMASYRVCNGKAPGRPAFYRLPDPCLYGHTVSFTGEIYTPAPLNPGEYLVTVLKMEVDEPTALWQAMSAVLEELHTELDNHPDWIEYRWKMFSGRGEAC